MRSWGVSSTEVVVGVAPDRVVRRSQRFPLCSLLFTANIQDAAVLSFPSRPRTLFEPERHIALVSASLIGILTTTRS